MKKTLLLLSLLSLVYADENPLSSQKQEILNLKRQQIENDIQSAKNSWITPINLSATTSKNSGTAQNSYEIQSSSINWNQDLFRSGGIYYTIKGANATGAANLLGVDIQEATFLKQIYTYKAQILRDTLLLQQDRLTLKNSDIDLLMIKAKYKAGLADITQLNQTTLSRDTARTNLITAKNALLSETYELKKLINDENIETILIPEIPLLTLDEYLQNNLELLQYDKQNEAEEASWKTKRSSYLPKLTFNGSYGVEKYDGNIMTYNGTAYNYGVTLSMPLDINTQSSLESSRLQYLQSKSSQSDRKMELKEQYAEHLNNIQDFKEKIGVADEMTQMYSELFTFTKQQVITGFKSKYDLESLGNSLQIQTLEKKIQNYNIIIEKVALYFDIKR